MEWISVADVPPDKDTNIWALDVNGGQANIYFKDDRWWFETFDIWMIEFPDPIAHWMPLPPPPS